MSNTERFLAYLQHYANRDIDSISAMFADDITLRDWNLAVSGIAAAVAETTKNFQSAQAIEIEALHIYEREDAIAGELRILLDGVTELFVVDVLTFDADGRIKAIRAYLGRGDQ
jgi:hypothetical protein